MDASEDGMRIFSVFCCVVAGSSSCIWERSSRKTDGVEGISGMNGSRDTPWEIGSGSVGLRVRGGVFPSDSAS